MGQRQSACCTYLETTRDGRVFVLRASGRSPSGGEEYGAKRRSGSRVTRCSDVADRASAEGESPVAVRGQSAYERVVDYIAGFSFCCAAQCLHRIGEAACVQRCVGCDRSGVQWLRCGDWGGVKSAGEGARSGEREARGLTMQSANPLGKWPLQIAAGCKGATRAFLTKRPRRVPNGKKFLFVLVGSTRPSEERVCNCQPGWR